MTSIANCQQGYKTEWDFRKKEKCLERDAEAAMGEDIRLALVMVALVSKSRMYFL